MWALHDPVDIRIYNYNVKIISKRLLSLCKRSTKLGKRLPQLWKRLLKQCLVSKRLPQSSRC